ncbi:MAG TPA: TRAP transporter substrate-binding protein DctP [Verrucomicrobiae bacterium]|nr:TRAP transporter substrate-binding protein DctP [Verrucomicrobiae bacterium]
MKVHRVTRPGPTAARAALALLAFVAAPLLEPPALGAAPAASPVTIKMATVAPEGSPWHEVLKQMGQDWERASGGRVKLRLYPGGVLGDEASLVTKLRIGQLHAAALSAVGLYRIDRGVACLGVPMMFDTYDELDRVRDQLTPRLEKAFEAQGYMVLNWGDAGWIRFFTKAPAKTPDDIRRTKLFIAADDAETLELYKALGVKPVPLAETDILSSLQTGLITAFDAPPLLALLNQWFGVAPYMLDVRWAPLVGATVISRKAFATLPEDVRPQLLEAGRAAGERFRGDMRRLSEEAIPAMEKRGLKVTRPDDATLAAWRREAEGVWPRLRGSMVPADLFDEAKRLRDQARSGKPSPP